MVVLVGVQQLHWSRKKAKLHRTLAAASEDSRLGCCVTRGMPVFRFPAMPAFPLDLFLLANCFISR
jgi:hypothetical protein